MRLHQPTSPRRAARRPAKLLAACAACGLLALPAAPARAGLYDLSGSTDAGGLTSFMPQPLNAGVTLNFSSYGTTAMPYSLAPLVVDQTAKFGFAVSGSGGIPVGIIIVAGGFSPSTSGPPATPLANFVAGSLNFSSTTTLTNITLNKGQAYTIIITSLFGTSTTWTMRAGGGACIAASLADCVESASALGLVPWNGASGVIVDAPFTMVSDFLDTLITRLDAIRYADDGNDAALARFGLDAPGTGMAAAGRAPRQGFWTRASADRSTQSTGVTGVAYATHGWGFAAGYDREVGERMVAGLALAYHEGSIGFQQQPSAQGAGIKSYQASAYASRRFDAFYVDAMLGYARQRYATRRDDFDGTDTGNFSGNVWSARLSAGLPLSLGDRYTLTPQARADYMYLTSQAYTENGGASAQAVDAMHGERIRSGVGAQLAYSARLGKIKALPYVNAFWNHDFHNNGLTGSVTQGGVTVQVQGAPTPRNTYTTGIGASLLVNDRFSALVSLDHEAGGGYKSDTARLTGRWAF